jgi:hypothetical protein
MRDCEMRNFAFPHFRISQFRSGLLHLAGFLELSFNLLARFFGLVIVQTEILQRLPEASARRQSVQNRCARYVRIRASEVLR